MKLGPCTWDCYKQSDQFQDGDLMNKKGDKEITPQHSHSSVMIKKIKGVKSLYH